MDATYLKAHRTACSLRAKKGGRGRQIGRTKGFEGERNCPVDSFARERNTKLHALTDAKGRPIRFFMSAGPPLGDAGVTERAAGQ